MSAISEHSNDIAEHAMFTINSPRCHTLNNIYVKVQES